MSDVSIALPLYAGYRVAVRCNDEFVAGCCKIAVPEFVFLKYGFERHSGRNVLWLMSGFKAHRSQCVRP